MAKSDSRKSSTSEVGVKLTIEDDFTRCIKNMEEARKPKVKSAHKKKQQQKTCKRTAYYLTTGRKVDFSILGELKKCSGVPFRIPQEINEEGFMDKFLDGKRNDKLKDRCGGYALNQNYSSRLRLNKVERLYVPEKTKLPGKCVTDHIDPEYYTIIAGRPIKEKKDIREYFKDVRNCFLTRLKTGFQLDEILQMDEQYIEEKQRLEEIRAKYEMYMNCFDKFLTEDHSASVELLKTAEVETKLSNEKEEVFVSVTDELNKLRAQVLILEEQWRNCKMFQKFLYSASPAKWRKEFDYSYRKKRHKAGGVDPTDTSRFERCRGPSLTRGDSLEQKIARFKREISKCQPPALYFEDSNQLQEIFGELEKNNLIALSHCEKLDPPAREMARIAERGRVQFDEEQKVLEEEIVYLRGRIVVEEEKGQELEKEAKRICFGLLRGLIMNEQLLTVTAYVQDAYEDVIGPPEDDDPNVVDMIKEIELKHEELLLSLDTSPNDVVVQMTRSFYKEQDRIMKEAHDAGRKVHEMEILLKRLSKSLTYPRKSRLRRLFFRSEPPMEIMEKIEPPKFLTRAEKEQKYFFEPYCRNTDGAPIYRPLCA